MSSELAWTGERLVTNVLDENYVYEHLHRYAIAQEFAENKVVLDIASGEGYGTFLLSKKAQFVYGVDIDKTSIAHAANKYKKNNISFLQGSTSRIPLQNESVDMVVSFETLEHHDEHEQMMLEIKRVLKKDGILIISSPNKEKYNERTPKNPFHVKELNFSDLQNLLNSHFTSCHYYNQYLVTGSLVVPVMPLSNINKFSFYDGNYSEINTELKETGIFNKAFFCLAICTNGNLNPAPTVSLFNGAQKVFADDIKNYNKGAKSIKKTIEYKIGDKIMRFLKVFKK